LCVRAAHFRQSRRPTRPYLRSRVAPTILSSYPNRDAGPANAARRQYLFASGRRPPAFHRSHPPSLPLPLRRAPRRTRQSPNLHTASAPPAATDRADGLRHILHFFGAGGKSVLSVWHLETAIGCFAARAIDSA